MDFSSANLTVTDEIYFIHSISGMLAGRIAEELFNVPQNSGSYEDLEFANELAKDVATKYGLCPYTGDIVISENSSAEPIEFSQMQDYASNLLKKSHNLAEKVITENKSILIKLISELVKKVLLTRPEIDALMKN